MLARLGAGRAVDCGDGLVYPLFDGIVDLEVQRRAMAASEVSHAVVGLPPPGVDGLSDADAIAVARACNDELAAVDDGFTGLATLPLRSPAAAARELERAVAIGLPAAQLWSNAAGEPVDANVLAPLLEAAAGLDVPLVMHPTLPPRQAGLDDHALRTTLGFVYETTTCALRLIFSGLFERHPEFKLLVPHAGSLLPWLAGRLDYESQLFGASHALSMPPSEHVKRLYVDSVCLWPPALALTLEMVGPERVLFGTDYPFWPIDAGIETVERTGLGGGALEQVCHANAQRLFAIS